MEENGNIYLLINYTLANLTTLDELGRNYPDLIFKRITPGIYTVQVPEGAEAQFVSLNQNIKFIAEPVPYGLNAKEALEASNIQNFHNYPYGALRGTGVLIGFVDTGIDYVNTFFRNADGTSRIASIWDQTIQGNPPEKFGYGSVYNQETLNVALASEDPYAIVPTRDTNGHGTYLAGVAAGNDQSGDGVFIGGAPDAEIIMVKLRPASERVRRAFMINEGEIAYQNNDILTGIQFLLDKASELGWPLVICIGLGNNYGAHNGTDVIEQYLSQISSSSGIIVVIAAGNETSSGHHYKGQIVSGQRANVEINVGENESGFVMYLWANLPNKLYVSFRSPLGQVIERVPVLNQQDQRFKFNLEQTVLVVRYLYTEPFTGSEEIAISFIEPTPGIWTISVEGESIIDGIFHIWLPRRGFINETTRFLQPDPEYTVQVPGTNEYTIVVGAYDSLDDSLYVASGRGPTTSNIIKPDIVAPGVNVQGPRVGGGFTTFVGTSTAAAITASASALLLEWGIINQNVLQLNTRIARGIFARGARRLNNVSYPNNIEGYGRLDLQGSLVNI